MSPSPVINTVKSTTTETSCLINFWSQNHMTSNCRTCLHLTLENKYKILNKKSACYGCLSNGHAIKDCRSNSPCSVNGCPKLHHASLHIDEVSGNSHSTHNTRSVDLGKVILPIMKIVPQSKFVKSLSCLWDGGADISLITNTKARQMKLHGKPVILNMVTAGGQNSVVESMAYDLEILDKYQNIHTLNVFGIDSITKTVSDIDLKPVVRRFKNIKLEEIVYPSGDVDVLISYDYAGWHPVPEQISKHLVILGNIFGKCVGGKCNSLVQTTEKSTFALSSINVIKADRSFDQFMTIESLGVHSDPRCGSCKCGSCPIGGKSYTIKEERELKMIENNLEFKGTYWVTGYSWMKNPYLLPDNYIYVLKRLEATERRLRNDPVWMNTYSSQINDMVKRGVARKLSEEEIKTYAGSVHYIAHHAVSKPDSETTPYA